MEITIGIPQLLMIALTIIGLVIAIGDHGEWKQQSFWGCLVATGIQMGLLYWGGFFS